MTFNPDTIKEQVIHHRNFFNTGKTKSAASRVENLKRLKKIILENETEISLALKKDLNKSSEEAFMTEINETLREIDHAIKKTAKWMKPERTMTPLVQQPARSYIQPDPLGVVLIIGPWNYPFVLLMVPLAAALSAGNCAILKPSEMAPDTSRIIGKLIRENFDPGLVSIVEGGIDETTALLKEKFDHIFFTGGPAVGKIVMRAASSHLTPVTLELGGKSPCIVDSNVHLKYAAKELHGANTSMPARPAWPPTTFWLTKKSKTPSSKRSKKMSKTFSEPTPNIPVPSDESSTKNISTGSPLSSTAKKSFSEEPPQKTTYILPRPSWIMSPPTIPSWRKRSSAPSCRS